MATESTESTNWKKRESFGSAMIQIIIVGLLLAGTVYFVYKRGADKKEIHELLTQARTTEARGNLADVKKALTVIDEAIAKDSGSPDANALAAAYWTDLWLIHHEPGAEAKAKEFLEKAKKADSQGEARYGTEAMHLVAAGKFKEADTFVEELRKKGGSGARLFLAQGLAQKSEGELKLALASLRASMEKEWKDLNFTDAYGEELLAEGAHGAVDTFMKANAQNSDHFRTRLGLALARVQARLRVGDAEVLLKETMDRKDELSAPQKARAAAIGALILDIQEQYDPAIQTADIALKDNPDDAWALHAKALALAGKKDPGAAAAAEAVIAKAPASPIFYFENAAALQKAGQLDAGLGLLAKYEGFFKNVKTPTADGKEEIYLDRDDRYWLARGELLKNANKTDEAMVSFDKAIAAKSLNLSRAYYQKGQLLLDQKQFDKAAEILQDITPPDGSGTIAEAYMAMGDVLFEKKDWGPACQNYAYALTRMKLQQQPREKLNEVITDVEKRLKAANQKEIAKVWVEESKPLIQ